MRIAIIVLAASISAMPWITTISHADVSARPTPSGLGGVGSTASSTSSPGAQSNGGVSSESGPRSGGNVGSSEDDGDDRSSPFRTSGLMVCNRTITPDWVAMALQRRTDGVYSTGWVSLSSGDCAQMALPGERAVYLYATDQRSQAYGGDSRFCVNLRSNAQFVNLR